ncbi:family 20 glycosylhydrolase [Akkermansia sp.]|uniref:family 20 glycosylhydrolase n=1 Tax=Akkermansia sp. TaxID=1872421 RepID=UPI0025BCC807|nr:family 20 glycosylhydrolase [Akkermansia sp.]MCC8148135.1 family 20 glycosylhydrolase [Akkermansia sp.]
MPVWCFAILPVYSLWSAHAGEVVTAPVPEFSSPALIPYPAQVTRGTGEVRFKSVHVYASPDIPRRDDLMREMEDVFRMSGIPVSPERDRIAEGCVAWELRPDAGMQGERYVLSVSQGKVAVRAGSFSGFFNALQTLRQLISREEDEFFMPFVQISDEPAFALRGVMLDVGRYYMSPAFIKEMMRRVSRYKINVLHLHLTDDPAWRLEVKKHPALTDGAFHWKSRQPGRFYTQEQLKDLVEYCARLNIQVIPEIDMPGHSRSFTRAMNTDMQTEEGVSILKDVVDEAVSIFPGRYFHMGSDEVHMTMKDFVPRMAEYIRGKGKEVVVWSPGGPHDKDSVLMCWGESEVGVRMDKEMKRIDSNGFYIDWADSQSGVYQVFFQQPCEVPRGDEKALGAVMPVWCDGNLSSEKRVLEQYPFYPCALTFAERVWRGSSTKRKDYMAQLPPRGTAGWTEFREFEERLASHRDSFFRGVPFAYVKQADMAWSLVGPFDHRGRNDMSFEPERKIAVSYRDGDRILTWKGTPVYGGAVHIRHLFAMFNMHRNQYRLDHWPTLMSEDVGKGAGTCYALTSIRSPREQEVWLMFGLNGMWGHSGGYRSARAPEQGSWDFSGGDVWLNGKRVKPPKWPFKSLPWGGWGKGRIEEAPLTWEGYFFRPPVKVKLRKGVNRVLIRSVFGHWKGDSGQRGWFFCCIPVLWDGIHYREVPGLEYDPVPDAR